MAKQKITKPLTMNQKADAAVAGIENADHERRWWIAGYRAGLAARRSAVRRTGAARQKGKADA